MDTCLRSLTLTWLLLPLSVCAEFPRLHLKPVVLDQIDSPTVITHADDGSGRLFVCDQAGLIRIVRQGMLLPTPFLDLTAAGLARIYPATTGGSERGLLGLAFHPDFAEAEADGEGRFYVYFSAPSASNPNPTTPQEHLSIVSEFRVSPTDPDRADPTSERVVLSFGQPQGNHNGGQIEFGPDDLLYIGTGDGGGANDNGAGHTGNGSSGGLGNSLDRTKLLGKILRIDPLGSNGPGGTYGIPADNPFVGSGGGVREEIYAYGLRNPWRFSFDQRPGGTGRLFCGDVGQGSVEEVNLIVPGGNYGWRYREGTFEFDPAMTGAGNAPLSWIDPVAQYAHPGVVIGNPNLPQLGLSITGGFIYRGSSIPGLQGKYVFADYRATAASGGRLMGLEETVTDPPSGIFTLVPQLPLTEANPLSGTRRIQTLGEDENGELYVGTKSNGGVLLRNNNIPAGGIYRIVAAVPTTSAFEADRDNSAFENTANSNGAGVHLYSGRTGSMGGYARRRALIRFNLGSLGANSEVTVASVILHQNLGGSAPVTMRLHRLTADWGESSSNAGLQGGQGAPATTGDTTWVNRIHPGTGWTTAGGDFVPTASASALIDSTAPDGPVPRTWSGPTLAADLNAWLTSPGTNFGWILIGDEAGETTAQRFASRETSTAGGSLRPRLEATFLGPPSPTPFEQFLTDHYPNALVGQFIEPDGDGDGIPLLLEHGYGVDPLSPDPDGDSVLGITTEPLTGAATRVRVTFRRNPTATDLRLTLRFGSDLGTWTTLAESLAGGMAVGQNGGTLLSDEAIPDQAPARLVTVEFIAPDTEATGFVRLEAELLP